jgi:branched-subunit amino acid ABC-type transport system permease component
MEAIEILFTASLWAAAIRIASPLILATLGELICERAGVLNLGIEGIMTVGAFAGWVAVYHGADLWTGLAIAALAGAAFGLLHGFMTVPLGLSQHVTGIGITLLATSLTYYAYRLAFPEVTSPPKIEPFAPFEIPGLSQIPFFGEALFRQTPLTYLAFLAVALVAYVLYRTPIGLAVRTVGENPAAVEAQGIRDGQRPRLDLHRAGGLRLLAAGQGAARCHPVRRFRRLSIAPPAIGRRLCALSGVPDAALYSVDPGAHRHVAPRRLSAGADDRLSQGRALTCSISSFAAPICRTAGRASISALPAARSRRWSRR